MKFVISGEEFWFGSVTVRQVVRDHTTKTTPGSNYLVRFCDCGNDRVVCRVSNGSHFVVGAILDRVRHEYALYCRKAQCVSLRFGGLDKNIRGDEHRWHTASFKINDVVHTARRATASIGEGLDNQSALRGDFVAQINWRWLGECRLAKAQDFCASSCQS